ncbi:MAG: hypothetical protein ACM3KR_00065 [Deltaproteobacteria bacterium]
MNKKIALLLIMAVIVISSTIAYLVIKEKNTSQKVSKTQPVQTINNAVEIKAEDKKEKEAIPKEPKTTSKEQKAISDFNTSLYHPIFIEWGNDENSINHGYILGGSKDGKWYSLEDFDVKYKDKITKSKDFNVYCEKTDGAENDLLKGNEDYKIYSDNKFINTTRGIKQYISRWESSGELYQEVEVKPFKAKEGLVIAVNGEWNALPRVPDVFSDRTEYVIDIDNDEKNELIKIEKKNTGKVEEGNGYKIEEKKVTSYIEKDGKKITIHDNLLLDGIYEADYKVYTMDLNGDGKLEIVTEVDGHNTSISVFEMKDGKVVPVFGYYMGD